MDHIDRERLGKILKHRYIDSLPLWDVMHQTTLKNGVNALTYFQQMVRAITPAGKTFVPQAGTSGYSVNQQMQMNAERANAKQEHADKILAAQELEAAKELIAKKG